MAKSIRFTRLLPFSPLLLLIVPLVAMQFSEAVVWSGGDFLVMGTLLLGASFATSLILNRFKATTPRILLLLLVGLLFLLTWAELAVGVFGTPFGGS